MCNENRNTILQLDFSVADETNWTYTAGDTASTQGQTLDLNSNNTNNYFERILGTPNPANNRLDFAIKFKAKKTAVNTNPIEVRFQILNNVNNVLYECSEILQTTNENTFYNFYTNRTFKYSGTLSQLKLRVYVWQGIEHTVSLQSLKFEDYNYCIENIKTYFVLDSIYNQAQKSKFGKINFLNWKVDGVETLTQDFFTDNSNNVSDLQTDWKFCISDLDGQNRIANNSSNANSWNPFVNDCGLTYDNSNYYDGVALSVTNGNNYGTEITKLGIDLPYILNGILQAKKMPFFIHIDYTKNLHIVFDVILGQSSNIYDSVDLWRRYEIKWNKDYCKAEFFYTENPESIRPNLVDDYDNGFLSGTSGNNEQVLETQGGLIKKIEIAPGDCQNWLFGSPIFAEVFIPGAGIGYIPQLGDTVYLNSNFTQVFDGSAGHSYRMRTETSSPLILNYVFNISATGQIINLAICEPLEEQEIYLPFIQQIAFPVHNDSQLTVRINVANAGGGTLSECGVVFNTTGNPTINDNKEIYNNQLGLQNKVITRPVFGQKYYFSAYAINEAGIVYKHYNYLV